MYIDMLYTMKYNVFITTMDGGFMNTMEKIKEQTLKTIDRCDRCQSQAFVVVKGIEGDLIFCGHHFTKYEEALYNWAYEIIDEREFINAKPQSSA